MKNFYLRYKEFPSVVILNNNFKFIFFFKNNNVFFLSFFFFIYINDFFFSIWKFKSFFDVLNIFFYSWKNFIFRKIKFKHKISWFYIYRKNYQFIKLTTNLAKKVFFFTSSIRVKRKKNYFHYHSLVFWGLDLFFLVNFLKTIIQLFYLNSYTLKGFKFSRMFFLRRVGKVNKYSTLKNKLI